MLSSRKEFAYRNEMILGMTFFLSNTQLLIRGAFRQINFAALLFSYQ